MDSEQIVKMSDYDVLKSTDLSYKEIIELKERAAKMLLSNGFECAEAIKNIESEKSKIPIGPSFNKLLNGGLDRGCITEIYGESGCGKTQFGLQIAVNCWNSGAVYICTEDIFPSKRLQQLFQHSDSKNTGSDKNLMKYGENIYILQIIEVEDLMKCVLNQLPALLETKKTIDVVILDSIAAPFRGSYDDNAESNIQRAQHLKDIGIGLLECAKTYNLAVLCINQVSSVPSQDSSNDFIPCLGLSWSNMINTRIQVRKTKKYLNEESSETVSDRKQIIANHNSSSALNIREFQVVFSSCIPSDVKIKYVIKSDGITVVDE